MARRLLKRSDLRHYQEDCIQDLKDNPYYALWLDMGLGKTVSTLTAIEDMIRDGEVNRVLIIGPKRVVSHTWPTEFKTWEHLSHRVNDYAVCAGSLSTRLAALKSNKTYTMVNRENVVWLVDECAKNKSWPFDTVIIDESSSFKNPSAKRVRALARPRKAEKIKRMVQLTGTPSPRSYEDLFAQMYLLDRGKALSSSVSKFRRAHFTPDVYGYGWDLIDGHDEIIRDKIAHLVKVLDTVDYLDLPDVVYNPVYIKFDDDLEKQYKEFAKEYVLDHWETEVTAANAGALYGKLLQFAGGNVYDEDQNVVHVHDLKLDALEEIYEDAAGQPVLVAYNYEHEKDALLKRFKKARVLERDRDIDDWNDGKIPMLICHPASAGHGLNLQHGGHILVWYGINLSLELYQQFNKRLHRSGQLNKVILHHLIVEGTVDELAMASVGRKGDAQSHLLKEVQKLGEKLI